jgi:hypothetical protein
VRRGLGSKFFIEDGNLFKNNGQLVPPEEPVFLLRARDNLAVPLLKEYHELCGRAGCNDWQLQGVEKTISEFEAFSRKNLSKMKQPGKTKGA